MCNLGYKFFHYDYCSGVFQKMYHDHETRGRNQTLRIPNHTSEFMSRSVVCKLPSIWNAHVRHVQQSNSYQNFEKNIKSFLYNTQNL